MKKKYTLEEVKQIVNNLGYKLISKEYINNKQRLILCDNEGYYYLSRLDNLLSLKIPDKYSKYNPYTIQNIKLWCKLNNKPFELLSKEYINNHEKLKWKCLIDDCGEEFEASWNSILNGTGCPYCSGQKVCLLNCLATKNPQLAKEWHPTLNGSLTPYDVTCNNGKKVWWLCSKNPKHEWKTTIASRNRGNYSCPYCSRKYASEDYNLLICNPELASEWNYKFNNKKPENYCPGSEIKVWWKCKECDHEWLALISGRNYGFGCPKCNQSKGEKEIEQYLIYNNFIYHCQYKIINCKNINSLPFDFAIFWDEEKTQLRMLIEYDGIQHFKPIKYFGGEEKFKFQQKTDFIKNEYCKNNNIKLLRIPYWEFDNIKLILAKELY